MDDERKQPGRSRKAIIAWTAGTLAVLALAWFVAAVAVPITHTHMVLGDECAIDDECHPDMTLFTTGVPARLGGPESAIPRLAAYLRTPAWLATRRRQALYSLGHCGYSALAPVKEALATDDEEERKIAAFVFYALTFRRLSALLDTVVYEAEEKDVSAVKETLARLIPKSPVPKLDHDTRQSLSTAFPDVLDMFDDQLTVIGEACRWEVKLVFVDDRLRDIEVSPETAAAAKAGAK